MLDGVDHGLDFGTSGVAGNTMIVFPCGKKSNYFIYEFSQGAFYDTPECHQYTCRAGNDGLLHCPGKDTAFEFEYLNGQITGIWGAKTHGNLETFFYSRQDGKAAPAPAGRFFDEIRGVYSLSDMLRKSVHPFTGGIQGHGAGHHQERGAPALKTP